MQCYAVLVVWKLLKFYVYFVRCHETVSVCVACRQRGIILVLNMCVVTKWCFFLCLYVYIVLFNVHTHVVDCCSDVVSYVSLIVVVVGFVCCLVNV